MCKPKAEHQRSARERSTYSSTAICSSDFTSSNSAREFSTRLGAKHVFALALIFFKSSGMPAARPGHSSLTGSRLRKC